MYKDWELIQSTLLRKEVNLARCITAKREHYDALLPAQAPLTSAVAGRCGKCSGRCAGKSAHRKARKKV